MLDVRIFGSRNLLEPHLVLRLPDEKFQGADNANKVIVRSSLLTSRSGHAGRSNEPGFRGESVATGMQPDTVVACSCP